MRSSTLFSPARLAGEGLGTSSSMPDRIELRGAASGAEGTEIVLQVSQVLGNNYLIILCYDYSLAPRNETMETNETNETLSFSPREIRDLERRIEAGPGEDQPKWD